MSRQIAFTDSAPPPAGPYSQAVRSGPMLALAGQGGFDPATGELAGPDFAAEARRTFANLLAVLEAAGAGPENVIRLGVFLTDPVHFQEMNSVLREFFTEPFPARTTVYVTLPGAMRIEVDALAVV